MEIIEFSINEKIDCSKNISSLTMGFFDGLHLGHQTLIKKAVSNAKKNGGLSALLTFKPHPRSIIFPNIHFQSLIQYEYKLKLIEKMGVDVAYVLKFDDKIRNASPADFFKEILVDSIAPKKIVVGFNFSFGKNATGNVAVLSEFCLSNSIDLEIISPVKTEEGILISSSNIKAALSLGDIRQVNKMLGRQHVILCKVTKSDESTLSLRPDKSLLTPSNGVYSVGLDNNPIVFKANFFENTFHIQSPRRIFLEGTNKEIHFC